MLIRPTKNAHPTYEKCAHPTYEKCSRGDGRRSKNTPSKNSSNEQKNIKWAKNSSNTPNFSNEHKTWLKNEQKIVQMSKRILQMSKKIVDMSKIIVQMTHMSWPIMGGVFFYHTQIRYTPLLAYAKSAILHIRPTSTWFYSCYMDFWPQRAAP